MPNAKTKAVKTKVPKLSLAGPIIGLVFALYLVGWYGVLAYMDRYVNPKWPRIQATVVDHRQRYETYTYTRRVADRPMYVPEYYFLLHVHYEGDTLVGDKYTGVGVTGDKSEPSEFDRRYLPITVAYNPDNPAESKQVTDTTKQAVQLIILSVIAGIIMLISIKVFIKSLVKVLRARHHANAPAVARTKSKSISK
jgi:hypothetical protein